MKSDKQGLHKLKYQALPLSYCYTVSTPKLPAKQLPRIASTVSSHALGIIRPTKNNQSRIPEPLRNSATEDSAASETIPKVKLSCDFRRMKRIEKEV